MNNIEKEFKKYDAIHGEILYKSSKYIKLFKRKQKKIWEEPLGLYYRKDLKLFKGVETSGYSIYHSIYGITFSKECKITDINKPNKNKILILKNLIDYKKFKKKYKVKYNKKIFEENEWTKKDLKYLYNWEKVEKDFGGIEWCNDKLIHKFFDLKWNGDGCIWNNELIKSVKCFAKLKKYGGKEWEKC